MLWVLKKGLRTSVKFIHLIIIIIIIIIIIRLRPLPLSLVGWCASCNNNNKFITYIVLFTVTDQKCFTRVVKMNISY